MSATKIPLVDESLDVITPHLREFTEREFWSHVAVGGVEKTEPSSQSTTTRVRSLFLSDLHLGFRHSRVRSLLDFLNQHEPWVENCTAVIEDSDGDLRLTWI